MPKERKWQLRNVLHAFDDFFDNECKSAEGACNTVKAAMEMLLTNLS